MEHKKLLKQFVVIAINTTRIKNILKGTHLLNLHDEITKT